MIYRASVPLTHRRLKGAVSDALSCDVKVLTCMACRQNQRGLGDPFSTCHSGWLTEVPVPIELFSKPTGKTRLRSDYIPDSPGSYSGYASDESLKHFNPLELSTSIRTENEMQYESVVEEEDGSPFEPEDSECQESENDDATTFAWDCQTINQCELERL